MGNEQVAALYLELVAMYAEEYAVETDTAEIIGDHLSLFEKIEDNLLSKQDIAAIEPMFIYGHIDVHKYLTARKRFIWF